MSRNSVNMISTHRLFEEEDTVVKNVLQAQEKDLKLKVIPSLSPLSLPHHIHYQPFLKALLQMSYIPTYPILRGAPKITSRRLDE